MTIRDGEQLRHCEFRIQVIEFQADDCNYPEWKLVVSYDGEQIKLPSQRNLEWALNDLQNMFLAPLLARIPRRAETPVRHETEEATE